MSYLRVVTAEGVAQNQHDLDYQEKTAEAALEAFRALNPSTGSLPEFVKTSEGHYVRRSAIVRVYVTEQPITQFRPRYDR